jgi:hypothetical protein
LPHRAKLAALHARKNVRAIARDASGEVQSNTTASLTRGVLHTSAMTPADLAMLRDRLRSLRVLRNRRGVRFVATDRT